MGLLKEVQMEVEKNQKALGVRPIPESEKVKQ